jgi:hypothetical protein
MTDTLVSKEELAADVSIAYASLEMAPLSPLVVPSVVPAMPTLEVRTCEFVFFLQFLLVLSFC